MYKEIYLVDDEELINTVNAIQFRKLGLEDKVKSFTNPEWALDNLRFREDSPERIIVFLDINMPEMSGFEFLEFMYLEKFPQIIDVVIVTSSISEDDLEMSRKFKKYVRGFIKKPLKKEDIQAYLKVDMPLPETSVAGF
ncbi:MAG: response regulator [Bacteroidota bacterium]|uniref:Response regulator n=1 Tax=Flagellimonas profundi TaxID=2915620 RepID=A0ABS3FGR7_9FLAO|nr:response regulator [Allomuricauda profundi]MBO0342344.1 response regulator [Allomuricauda profundi]MEC7770950.1 response regulator [Bacteroidota bacterium]